MSETGSVHGVVLDWNNTLFPKRGSEPYPYSKEVLTYLKDRGYSIGLISKAGKRINHNISQRQAEIAASGLSGFFSSIVVDSTKNQDHFLRCLEELGIDPSHALVVGDRAPLEIKAGNELGCFTAWVQNGNRKKDRPNEETGDPTYTIDTVERLLDILP